MSESSNRRSVRRILALAVTIAVGSGLAAGFALGSNEEGRRDRGLPTTGAYAGHGPSYSSLRELAQNSALVLVGTVTQSGIGEVFEDDPTGQYPTRLVHTTVDIDESFKGSPSTEQVTIATDELAFSAPNLQDWRTVETRVLLFLTPSVEGRYVLANLNYPQTAYFVRNEDVEAAIRDPLSQSVAAMTVSEIRRKIRE
jgi:hypothetical protein